MGSGPLGEIAANFPRDSEIRGAIEHCAELELNYFGSNEESEQITPEATEQQG